MKVEVDLNLCQAYGICAQLAPEVFELDDDGYAHVTVGEEILVGAKDRILESAAACPVQAILITKSE